MNDVAPDSHQNKPSAVFISTNKRYSLFANNLIHSILSHNSEAPDIIVAVTRDVHEGDIYTDNDRVHLIENSVESAWLSHLQYHPGVDPAVYYGRLMPFQQHQRFQEYGNILYLDADTTVCGDISPLLSRPGFFQVATPNSTYSPFNIQAHDLHHDIRRLCCTSEKDLSFKPELMWNSWVMLIPPEIRNDDVYQELLRIQATYGDIFQFADQSLFALWMAKHGIRPTHESQWNYMGTLYRGLWRKNKHLNYLPVRPKDARIYHVNTWYRPRLGLIEAKMVAQLGPSITMQVLSVLEKIRR